MIRSKIEVNGKTIAVCKVERRGETISTLLADSTSRKKKSNHQANNKQKVESNDGRLKYLLISLIASKQKFEVALFKAKLKLREFRKCFHREEK